MGEVGRGCEREVDSAAGHVARPCARREGPRAGPYDFIFIDGDHRYEPVKVDWENYAPLGGVVAFHDSLGRSRPTASRGCGQEIKVEPERAGWRSCQNETLPGNEGPCGIGIVWLD